MLDVEATHRKIMGSVRFCEQAAFAGVPGRHVAPAAGAGAGPGGRGPARGARGAPRGGRGPPDGRLRHGAAWRGRPPLAGIPGAPPRRRRRPRSCGRGRLAASTSALGGLGATAFECGAAVVAQRGPPPRRDRRKITGELHKRRRRGSAGENGPESDDSAMSVHPAADAAQGLPRRSGSPASCP